MVVGDVIQFNQRHKWCGCLGIIEEVTHVGKDEKYLVAVPGPEGTAYIRFYGSDMVVELIGKAALVHA